MSPPHAGVIGHRPLEFVLPTPAANASARDFFLGTPEQQADPLRSQYAMRSPLLPGAFFLIFRIAKWLGVEAYHRRVLPCALAIYSIWTSTLATASYVLVRTLLHEQAGDRAAALLAGAAVASHQVLATLGGNALLNSFLSPLTVASLAILSSHVAGRAWRALGGAALGVVLYARCDQLLLCLAFALTHPRRALPGALQAPTVGGGATSFLGMAALDWAVHGWPLASPIRWFVFNVHLGHGAMFGTEGADFYASLLAADRDMRTLATAAAASVTVSATKAALRARGFAQPLATWPGCHSASSARLLGSSALVVAAYSTLGHKELRFVHDAIAIAIAGLSIAAGPLVSFAAQTLHPGPYREALLVLVFAVLTRSGPREPGSWFATASSPWGSREDWELHSQLNRGLARVGAYGDATGVILVMPRYRVQLPLSCGWSCLHVPAPIGVVGQQAGQQQGATIHLWPPTINTEVCIPATMRLHAVEGGSGSGQGVDWALSNTRFNYAVLPSALLHSRAIGFDSSGFGEIVWRSERAIVTKRNARASADFDFFALWMKHTRGWNCHQYYRHAPRETPIAIDTWVPLPPSIVPAGGVRVRRGGSARDHSTAACANYSLAEVSLARSQLLGLRSLGLSLVGALASPTALSSRMLCPRRICSASTYSITRLHRQRSVPQWPPVQER